MRRVILAVLLALATLAPMQLLAQAKPDAKPQPAPPRLKIGDMAPDFTLLEYDGQKVKPVSLHDYRGKKNVALAFYVFAFTGG